MDSADRSASAVPKLSSRWAMAVAWPSFFMAGVMEALVFAVIDPSDLTWFGAERLDWSRQAVYTVSFMILWLVISLSASVSVMLATLPDLPEDAHPRGWPR
ncbi:hypothetical protein [Paucibacter sp. DJ2R-2]|uniref:hypothetical protein n=1 Tax=Paucibacter sp. DJ2R-2 TaxID=2893558 RepID=UPI0021E3A5FB|nr:hypothetical protein [Paucibacter sp. DJ2R-2]MCV2422168.1 hypothetical protein [Paucibacter sp. DJ4R-1]MCV2440248.1 hypothetical protein [Paucibacter sp. DJ2R-2]